MTIIKSMAPVSHARFAKPASTRLLHAVISPIGSAKHVLASTAPPLAMLAAPAQAKEHARPVPQSVIMAITSVATAPETIAPVAYRALSALTRNMFPAAKEQVVELANLARLACMGSTLQAAREAIRDIAIPALV